MRPAAFLFLALTCTLGCKSITEVARFHHSPTGVFAEQPIAKADDPLLGSGPINAARQIEAPAEPKSPEINPPPPPENRQRAAIVVSERPRPAGEGPGRALSRDAVPKLQAPRRTRPVQGTSWPSRRSNRSTSRLRRRSVNPSQNYERRPRLPGTTPTRRPKVIPKKPGTRSAPFAALYSLPFWRPYSLISSGIAWGSARLRITVATTLLK